MRRNWVAFVAQYSWNPSFSVGKSPVIVYENADLDSAVESVVDAIWFNQGHVCSAGSKLLVQEPVYEKFIGKLKTRLLSFRYFQL